LRNGASKLHYYVVILFIYFEIKVFKKIVGHDVWSQNIGDIIRVVQSLVFQILLHITFYVLNLEF
jgi:hypothetical protein